MRIGIDGGCLTNRRGFGRFARQTLGALARAGSRHEFVVFVDRPSADAVEIPEGFQRVVVEVNRAPSVAASSTGRRSLGDMLAMSRAVAGAGLDLMYFPASYSYFPVWGVRRVVVTMHDTLAIARPDLVFPTWQGRFAWALKEHAAVWRADRILTVSQAARRDLLAWFKLPADRVSVVTEGPDDVFRPTDDGPDSIDVPGRYGVGPSATSRTGSAHVSPPYRGGVGGCEFPTTQPTQDTTAPRTRYFLYVGGLSPHKNLPRLIEAFRRSGLGREGFKLVLVGDTGDVFHTHVPELRAAVAGNGLSDQVVFTGFVPDADLVHFYNRAEALVQPSLMEGFGLPPVEAMACGTPVVASTAGSLPEVIGDAGLFFEPTDVDGLAGALRRVVDEPGLRDELAARALRRASQFTWAASARATLDCFEVLASGDTGRRASA